jgi:hypothetical protein
MGRMGRRTACGGQLELFREPFCVGSRIWFRYINEPTLGFISGYKYDSDLNPYLICVTGCGFRFGRFQSWEILIPPARVIAPAIEAGARVRYRDAGGWVEGVVIPGTTQVSACTWPRVGRADIITVDCPYQPPATITVGHGGGRWTLLPIECVEVL